MLKIAEIRVFELTAHTNKTVQDRLRNLPLLEDFFIAWHIRVGIAVVSLFKSCSLVLSRNHPLAPGCSHFFL